MVFADFSSVVREIAVTVAHPAHQTLVVLLTVSYLPRIVLFNFSHTLKYKYTARIDKLVPLEELGHAGLEEDNKGSEPSVASMD